LELKLSWTSLESGVPFSMFLLFFAICMPLSGKLLKMYGSRRVALLGGLLVGVGWVLAGLSLGLQGSLLFVALFYGVIAGSGVAMVYNTAITVSSNWVPERRGLAVGLTVLGFGISPIVTAPAAHLLITSYGVQSSFLILGAGYGLALTALSLFMILPRAEIVKSQEASGQRGLSLSKEYSPREMVRSRQFAGLWLAYALGTLGGFIAISQAAKFGQEVVRLSPELAAAATSVFSIFNGSGRPIFGYLADRLRISVVSSLSFVLAICGSLLAIQASEFIIYMASYSILWLVFGGWLALAPRATSVFFGVRNLSVNYGIVFTAYGASALIGPTLASILWESLGQYIPVFLTTATLYGVGLIISNTLLRQPTLPERMLQVKAQ